ncbi:conjugal transfer protein [Streptomyces sp. MJM1172]|uniref:conjugal transfer protein n=1 Tax=Streptomyces sp. MJM1172 TaxID=1703926 RepID=UPI00093A321D|nr:conjugal transfer protein [Streptomyces sp. MJM1172]
MSTFKSVMRKILNLPEPREPADASQPSRQKPRKPEPVSVPAGAARWVEAGQRVQGERAEAVDVAAEPSQTRKSTAPWTVEEERSGTKFMVKFGRVVLWFVVGLAAFTGVRSWVSPDKTPQQAPVQVQQPEAYPVQEAQAVASRFAVSYLTFDEAAPQARATALARDLPKGRDAATGWNSKGKQSVAQVIPGVVTDLGGKRARVHVEVLVNAPAEPAKDNLPARPAEQKWVGLEVPVFQTSGRIVVTGEPGIVGVPTSGPTVTEQRSVTSDLKLSALTKPVIDGFFAEYGKGEVESVTAPGAVVAPLPTGMTLKSVQSWTADQGSGGDRTGTAVVIWQFSGAELEMTYRVQLTRVASAAAERWQVADVRGGLS